MDRAVVGGRVGDDQRALELLDEADVAAVLLPALRVDVGRDDVDELIGALLEGAAGLLILVLIVEGALAAAAAALAGLLKDVLQIELWGVGVVGDLDEEVADVVDDQDFVLVDDFA